MNSLALIPELPISQMVIYQTFLEECDMKLNKSIAVGILVVGFSSISMQGMAGDGQKGCDGSRHGSTWEANAGFDGRAARHLSKALELTDEQKATLKTQREANKNARDTLQGKVFEARNALTMAVNAGANYTELSALTETLGNLHAEQALAAANAQKAFFAVLTEDQKQTLAEIKSKRLERKANRKEARKSLEG